MKTVLEAALEVQRKLTEGKERFCFIGAIALQRWGEPRATRDVDVTVLCPFGDEPRAIDRMLVFFAGRIPDAREFALRNRVLLLKSEAGIPIDVALGSLPYEQRCVGRASDWEITPGGALRTCSAEDLVVLKAFASRTRDWADIEALLARRGASLDWNLVLEELAPLAAARDMPEILDRLRAMKSAL
ncbi:MAG: hypothetical protein EPO20_00505 [Betaproteobacteria bacterium]|nr:MAG: hypothetical protein EPO20_00505 [Betaproteobacteria bacterium]